jgi:hypothetical protein
MTEEAKIMLRALTENGAASHSARIAAAARLKMG